MPKTTVAFGEIMLRLAPPGFERFLQSPQFVATFGGGEANVAVAVASFGLPARYVTLLPPNIRSPMPSSANCAASAWIPRGLSARAGACRIYYVETRRQSAPFEGRL